MLDFLVRVFQQLEHALGGQFTNLMFRYVDRCQGRHGTDSKRTVPESYDGDICWDVQLTFMTGFHGPNGHDIIGHKHGCGPGNKG